jgi:hypothetical protein
MYALFVDVIDLLSLVYIYLSIHIKKGEAAVLRAAGYTNVPETRAGCTRFRYYVARPHSVCALPAGT